MQSHVSTPKPLKKRDVRPFLPLMGRSDDGSSGLAPASPPPTSAVVNADAGRISDGPRQLPAPLSAFPSRRSSDSGIVSPSRPLGEPADPEASQPLDSPTVTAASPAGSESPATKAKSAEIVAKRTPFCGRCRNHWPDKPVLVKGKRMSALHVVLVVVIVTPGDPSFLAVAGHKKVCPMRDCSCSMCRLTLKRQRVMATQVRVRRSQASHKEHAEILQIAGECRWRVSLALPFAPICCSFIPVRFGPLSARRGADCTHTDCSHNLASRASLRLLFLLLLIDSSCSRVQRRPTQSASIWTMNLRTELALLSSSSLKSLLFFEPR